MCNQQTSEMSQEVEERWNTLETFQGRFTRITGWHALWNVSVYLVDFFDASTAIGEGKVFQLLQLLIASARTADGMHAGC